MGLAPDAEAVLHELAGAAGSSRDLVTSLNDLLVHATQAVPSCLGASIALSRHSLPVILTVRATADPDRLQPVLSSLAIRLPRFNAPAVDDDGGSRSLTLYASAAHAFTSLTSDLLALLDLDPRQAIFDGHLELPEQDTTGDALRGQLADLSHTDLALGVLLDRGVLPAAGRRELERLASENRTTIGAAARRILAAVRRTETDT